MKKIGDLIGTAVQPTRESTAVTPMQQSQLSSGFQTFGDPMLELMLKEAESFQHAIEHGGEPRWLSYVGTCGSGKTHLAFDIFRWVQSNMRHCKNAYSCSWTRDIMFIDCHDLAAETRTQDWSRFDRALTAFFVVLDDLGAVRDPTGFMADNYMRILDKRLGRWTVVTSNLMLDAIASEIDARVASRLIRNGSTVVQTTATDYWLRTNHESNPKVNQ